MKDVYFEAWPDGRTRHLNPRIVLVRVRPTWIRYSDYNGESPLVLQFDGEGLRS